MHICMATDENYVSILKVTLLSVMENNKMANDIFFHILEDGLSRNSKESIEHLTSAYNRKVFFYSVSDNIGKIRESISNEWAESNSYVAYARLYLPEILDRSIERVLYLDCDTLVVDNIKSLFELEMDNRCIAAVRDVLPFFYKNYKGLNEGQYYNSGVLLIDCKKWREYDMTRRIVEYCYSHASDMYPDQDAINILLCGKIFDLPPSYCVFYPENGWSSKIQLCGHGSKEEAYYSVKELDEARSNPKIIHYVDTVLGRPWQANNINPYSAEWLRYYDMLPKEQRVEFSVKIISKRQRIFREMYRVLPISIFAKIYYHNRNKGIKKRIDVIERVKG